MAGLNRAHLLFLLAGFILRNTLAQNNVAVDTCGAANHFALYVHDGSDDSMDGIYKATAPFDAGNDFTKLPLATTENPTAVFKDVVEDLVYWAGNDVNIGKYIKRDTKAGGTPQATSLITCSGIPLGVGDATIITNGQLAASTGSGPATDGRLNGAGGWVSLLVPAPVTPGDAWISVGLQGRPTITGVTLQGKADAAMWTTTYAVEYSQDRITWARVKDAAAANAVFTGNTDQTTAVTQTFNAPIVALYVRIVPLTWVDNVNAAPNMVPALRFELRGCKVPQCVPAKLGVEDGSILNSQLTAKSGTASDGRLADPSSVGTWTAATMNLGIASNGEYVEVFLGGRVTVTGVQVQGGGTGNNWPTMIQAQYWDDSVTTPTWKTVKTDTTGATDWVTATALVEATNPSAFLVFPQAVSTTRIRIFPHTLNTAAAPTMRFEVVGCREPEISHLAVDGTCGSKKVYWIERGAGVGDKIHYADLEATNPTAQALTLSPTLTMTSKIVDIELDVANNLIYFARQDGSSSYIHSARLVDGSIQNTYQVSSANGNIQSISIDQDAQNVYYSVNANAANSGYIGYVNLALAASSNTLIYNPASTFNPYDIGVYDNFVYALENKDSIVQWAKTITGPSITSITNPKTVVVQTADLKSLAVDLQFVKCIDFPTVTLNAATYSKFETDSIVDVMLLREGDRRCCSMVGMTIGEIEALEPEDFVLLSNPAVSGAPLSYNVKFNAGDESVRLQFQIKQDNNVDATLGEGDEKFSVTLAGNQCAALGTPSSAQVTIKDYYSCYFIAEGDSSKAVTEGEVDQIQTVNVMRTGYLPQAGAINVAYKDGTATRFNDYDYSSNMVSFGTSSTGSASFTIKGDNMVESPEVEAFKMELTIPFGATNTLLCPDKSHEATISITDNDFRVYLKETHITTRENSVTVSIPVCREGYKGAGSVTVPFTVRDISAKAGSDYNNANNPSEVTFQSDQECTNAMISILNDQIGEPVEAFLLMISNPSSGELISGKNQTYIAISDDDLAFRIELDKYTVSEASDLFITLLREGDLENDEDVFLVAVSGVAKAGEDFAIFDRIEFKAGNSNKRAFIDIIDDSADEPSEEFTLRLINGAGTILDTATVTIEDNDEPPSTATQIYSFDRSSLTINENVGMLEVVVVRTRTEQAGSVTVTTSPGTATSDLDYIALNSNGPGSVAEFAEGSGRAMVNVEINDDINDESDESFTAQLSNPSDGTISSPSNVLITIVDNDGDGNGGDGGGDGGGDTATLSTTALIGIILGAIALALAILALAVCGCCLLMRQPQPTGIPAYPPPAGPPVYRPPVGYGPPRRPYNAQNNRGFRPGY